MPINDPHVLINLCHLSRVLFPSQSSSLRSRRSEERSPRCEVDKVTQRVVPLRNEVVDPLKNGGAGGGLRGGVEFGEAGFAGVVED